MKRSLIGLVAAAGLWLAATDDARAQLSISVGNPYTGSGVFIGGNPYGYGYGYGYPYGGYGYPYGGYRYPYGTYYSSGYLGAVPYGNYYSSGYAGYVPVSPFVGVTTYAPAYRYGYPYYGYGYGYPYRYGYGYRRGVWAPGLGVRNRMLRGVFGGGYYGY
jgi:hypothetical protein